MLVNDFDDNGDDDDEDDEDDDDDNDGDDDDDDAPCWLLAIMVKLHACRSLSAGPMMRLKYLHHYCRPAYSYHVFCI